MTYDTRLDGEVALVTGSSSGIGRGVALGLAAAGAKVVVNYPDAGEAPRAEAVCGEIESRGGQAIALQADVAVEADVQTLIKQARDHWGPITILVNNAGIAHSAPLEEIPVDIWDRLFAIHVRGAFLTSRLVLPDMYANKHGKVISTASQLAYKGAPGFCHYTAAKGAIISLTRSLSQEAAAHNVNVNCVAPGATQTPILDSVPDDVMKAIEAAIPLGRIASVDDIVPSYLLLASAAGRHYQGQCLSPNGGDVFL